MKKYLVLATMFMLSTAAHAANVTWYGSAGWRYSNSEQKSGVTGTNATGIAAAATGASSGKVEERTEKAHKFRGELGATGGWDNVEWGVGVRTNGTADINMPGGTSNTDWTTAANGSGDLGVGFNRAWFKYGNDWGFGDIGLVFGRQAPAFARGANQVFIDNDVNFDGLAQTWKWGSFGFSASQYVLGGVTAGTTGRSSYVHTDWTDKSSGAPGGLSVLYSFQPSFSWKFTDEIAAMFAVGMHQWSKAVGANFQNVIPNGGETGFGNATLATATGNTNTWATRVSQENSRHWQFLVNLTLPYTLAFDFEMLMNKDMFYGQVPSAAGNWFNNYTTPKREQDSTAWAASLSYGELKKSQDFMIGYAYHNKGLGAVYNTYTYDRVQAGMVGHEIKAAYNIANGFHVGAKYMMLDEKNGKIESGLERNKKIETNYWEVTTGVRF